MTPMILSIVLGVSILLLLGYGLIRGSTGMKLLCGCLLLLGGCVSVQAPPPLTATHHPSFLPGTIYSPPYRGEGLYLRVSDPESRVQTNDTDSISMQITIANGYSVPVLLCTESRVLYPFEPDPTIRIFDENSGELTRGTISSAGGWLNHHPPVYAHIPQNSYPNKDMMWSCMTSETIRHQNSFSWFTPTNNLPSVHEWFMTLSLEQVQNEAFMETNSPPTPPSRQIPEAAEKVIIETPIRLRYLVEGEWKWRVAETSLTSTVYRNKTRKGGPASESARQPTDGAARPSM